jgi:hypothetical protein
MSKVGEAEYQLTVARALISKPENWCQGGFRKNLYKFGVVVGAAFCAGGAMRESNLDPYVFYQHTPAYGFLHEAAGIAPAPDGSLSEWNDAPARTHGEVLAVYDAAIAKARELGV